MLGRLGSLIPGLRRDPQARLRQALASLERGWSLPAFQALQDCAGEGLAEAQFALGQRYEQALGVVQNLADAAHWYGLAAAQGHVLAQSRLGDLLLHGSAGAAAVSGDADSAGSILGASFERGVALAADPEAAAQWNRKAAGAGDAPARQRLARQLALGLGLPADRDAAEYLFRQGAEDGEPAACTALGILLAGGYGGREDPAAARPWLEPQAQAGDVDAQFWLAIVLAAQGEQAPALPTDPLQLSSVDWLRRAAEQGMPVAMHQLALACWSGRNTARDPAQAETWFRRAAARGVQPAVRALGQLLLEQPGDDGIEAANLLWQAAEKDDRRAAALLGELYLRGHGVPRDPLEAARWLERAGDQARPQALTALASLQAAQPARGDVKVRPVVDWLRTAAERGDLAAVQTLGSLYQQGQGVPADPAAAVAHFRSAAEAGSTAAAFYLALLLADTQSPLHDLPGAIDWFRRAAHGGHALAVCNLALLTISGQGLAADPAQAVAMLETAISQGNAPAAELLAEWYCDGRWLVPAPERARQLLLRALELGSTKAAALVVQARLQGADWKLDWARVRQLLEAAARVPAGDANTVNQAQERGIAAQALARLIEAGLDQPDGAGDRAAAEPWWRVAAEAGLPDAQAWMGDHQRALDSTASGATATSAEPTGSGSDDAGADDAAAAPGEPDAPATPAAAPGTANETQVSAASWYRRAAQQGHLGALAAYAGLLQARGSRSAEHDQQLFGLWLAAAQRGHALAQRQVARCYLEGQGCRTYPQAGVRWLESAATAGDIESAYLLACCHRDGTGTRRDPALARLWFERAAAGQHPAALHWQQLQLAARKAS